MAAIADILAVFGHIDRLVGENADNSAVVDTVESLLPGTTGFNQGWYSQVERLFEEIGAVKTGLPRNELPTLPPYLDALSRLSDPTTEDAEWLIPQQAKARYAAVVLTAIFQVAPQLFDDNELEVLTVVLGYADEGISSTRGAALRTLIASDTPSNAQWAQFIQTAFDAGLVSEDEVKMAPFNRGELRVVGNEICTQLDTPFHDVELELKDVEKVLDPRNWPGCAPKYWSEVVKVPSQTNKARWTRIYETVRPDPRVLEVNLTTSLIYRTDSVRGGTVINYDIDTDSVGTKSDNFVLVDQGYIWARKLDPDVDKGVQILTRKVARIQGLGVAALAVYAYALGWSTVGEDLILGCARRGKGTFGPEQSQAAGEVTPAAVPKVPGIPQIRPGDRQALIKKVVDAATGTVARRSAKTGRLVQKWVDGDLRPEDLEPFAVEAGRDLAETQKDLYTAAVDLVSFVDVKDAEH